MDDLNDEPQRLTEVRRYQFRWMAMAVVVCPAAIVMLYLIHGGNDWQIVAILVTATMIAAWIESEIRVRRALWYARNGIQIVAAITRFGGDVHGFTRVDFEYVVNGQLYRRAKAFPTLHVRRFCKGKEEFVLLIDPSNPKRFMKKYDVFPRAR